MSATNRRVKNELKQIQQDLDGITQSTGGYVRVFQHGDDPYHYQCVMQGPDGSPYHGGMFYLDIQIPADYPFVPPKMKFTTPIWHPYVSLESGAIYLDFLTQRDQWNREWTMQSVLLMIWSTLRDPILCHNLGAANLEAAIDYQENRKLFIKKAQRYTRKHAGVKTPTKNLENLPNPPPELVKKRDKSGLSNTADKINGVYIGFVDEGGPESDSDKLDWMRKGSFFLCFDINGEVLPEEQALEMYPEIVHRDADTFNQIRLMTHIPGGNNTLPQTDKVLERALENRVRIVHDAAKEELKKQQGSQSPANKKPKTTVSEMTVSQISVRQCFVPTQVKGGSATTTVYHNLGPAKISFGNGINAKVEKALVEQAFVSPSHDLNTCYGSAFVNEEKQHAMNLVTRYAESKYNDDGSFQTVPVHVSTVKREHKSSLLVNPIRDEFTHAVRDPTVPVPAVLATVNNTSNKFLVANGMIGMTQSDGTLYDYRGPILVEPNDMPDVKRFDYGSLFLNSSKQQVMSLVPECQDTLVTPTGGFLQGVSILVPNRAGPSEAIPVDDDDDDDPPEDPKDKDKDKDHGDDPPDAPGGNKADEGGSTGGNNTSRNIYHSSCPIL